jgi:N-acetylglucosamine malate deacetylase 1
MNLSEGHSPVLVLAPHTDDGEIGCGGFIAKAVEAGLEVHYVAFSSAQISIPPGMPTDTLKREVKAATRVLGIQPEHLIVLDFPTRHFPEHRQGILEEMIKIRDRIQPKLILVPSLNDVHQDHRTVAEEAVRCFRTQSLLSYEEPWNNITFSTTCFVTLEERHVEKKIDALRCYESQRHRTYLTEEVIRAIMATRGVQLRGGYAETFEVIRWML